MVFMSLLPLSKKKPNTGWDLVLKIPSPVLPCQDVSYFPPFGTDLDQIKRNNRGRKTLRTQ